MNSTIKKQRGRKKCYNKCKVVILRVYDEDLSFLERLSQETLQSIPKLILQFIKEKNVKR